jgi:membrane protease YdiL (CAAX protease family)
LNAGPPLVGGPNRHGGKRQPCNHSTTPLGPLRQPAGFAIGTAAEVGLHGRRVPQYSLNLSAKQAAGLTGRFVLFQAGLFIVIGIVSGVLGAIFHLPRLANATVNPVALIAVNSIAVVLVLRGQLLKNKVPWRALADQGVPSLPLLPAILLLIAGGGIVYSEIGNRMSALLPPPQWLRDYALPLFDLARHPVSGPFALVVMAAVTEEVLFRGMILRGLLARMEPVRAVGISAGLFAVMHLNPWQMPTAFLIGLVLGWVYLRTRSLALCIIGHGFNNAICLLVPGLPFVIDGFNTVPASAPVLFQPWWFNLLGIVVFAGGVFLFHRQAPRFPWPHEQLAEPPLLPVNST